jgi:hypothetical protein
MSDRKTVDEKPSLEQLLRADLKESDARLESVFGFVDNKFLRSKVAYFQQILTDRERMLDEIESICDGDDPDSTKLEKIMAVLMTAEERVD